MVQRRNEGAAPDGLREPGAQTCTFDWQRGEIPRQELEIKAVRGGGPGGQAINTTSNNMQVRWNIGASRVLSDEQKTLLRTAVSSRVTKADELIFVCQSERSQKQNTEEAIRRLTEFVRDAITPEVERVATKKPRRVKTRERAAGEADKRRKAGRGKVGDWE